MMLPPVSSRCGNGGLGMKKKQASVLIAMMRRYCSTVTSARWPGRRDARDVAQHVEPAGLIHALGHRAGAR